MKAGYPVYDIGEQSEKIYLLLSGAVVMLIKGSQPEVQPSSVEPPKPRGSVQNNIG